MKQNLKMVAMVSLMALASSAFAQSSQVTSSGQSTSAANGGALQLNSPLIDSHEVVNQGGVRYATSTAIAPALTSSNDTCMGSTSAGVQGMSVGVSIGSTWEDKNCRMLKNSRELWNMGLRGASIKLMCQDDDLRFALENTGIDCGETKQQWKDNGSKVAVRQVPQAPAVAQAPVAAPQVAADPKASAVEQHAAEIIQRDQASKNAQLASK